jgi:hypothetical protein
MWGGLTPGLTPPPAACCCRRAGTAPGSWDFGKADPDSIIKWLESDAEGAATLRVKRDVELRFVDNSHVTIVVRWGPGLPGLGACGGSCRGGGSLVLRVHPAGCWWACMASC